MVQFIFNPFPTLRTDRLILRQLEWNDADFIFEYQSNKENFKYVDLPIYTSVKEALNYISRMNTGIENNKWIIWAITDVNTNKILGTISIWNISIDQLKAELGYALFPKNVGKGIMTEALRKVVDYGFNKMELRSIEACTSSLNSKSIALLESNKFSKTSSFVEQTSNGESIKMDIYSRMCSD
ncbi:GNAT family N-acetyltransferase [Chengkuizengella marina]|uniref:N-acetyltransferase n=1 Tax=Chengkuizengella marina TaxID=2507566 RepID=A0A6N9Q7V2_9BACL|nr:GNAT family N-acetyltransferase [Chengkuizengella marina]NBI30938.1 N-acetyltransferase [Chengkuizengella marina]